MGLVERLRWSAYIEIHKRTPPDYSDVSVRRSHLDSLRQFG